MAITLARNWLNAGREVIFLVGERSGGLAGTIDPRARVVELSPSIPETLTSRLRLGKAMASAAPGLAPDVIYLIGNYHFGLAAALKKALPCIPIVAKVTNPLLSGFPRWTHMFARPFLTALVRAIDVMVYMAPELAHSGDRLLPHKALEVIAEPNLPSDNVLKQRTLIRNRPRILAIGRLERQKRMGLAIRAFGEFRKTNDAEMVILGEGPDRPALQALVKKLGLSDSVKMPGFTSHVQGWLVTASVLLMSSRFEGYPAVVAEALASDVPVVTTDCSPALSSLLPSPVHGSVVSDASPAALAAALDKAVALPSSSQGVRPATVAHNGEAASSQSYLALFDRLTAAV